MPPIYRIIEVCIYAFLNFLPFMLLALYPFRKSLRFSDVTTVILIILLTLLQLGLGIWAAFFSHGNAGIISIVSTALYAVFYFSSVDIPVGKTLFTLLMISNVANLAVISAKCIEGYLFPELALQSYRWSFSLILFIVEIILCIPIFFYIKKIYTPAVEREPSGLEWHYLWIIPSTFYLMWNYIIYGNSNGSSLETAMRPSSVIFLFLVNAGALLVYSIVAKLVLEQQKIMELQARNHQLSTQALQYGNLQDKITEARRAKHDVRHHITLMKNYLENEDYDALRNYLNDYQKSMPDDDHIHFCDNTAVNAILLYFSGLARNLGISYTVSASVPENISISKTDLSVLFGNLLENAMDACKQEHKEDKKIIVRANTDAHSFCVTIDNTFSGSLNMNEEGQFFSSKHEGLGLGTESIKSIAGKYNGSCQFEANEGMFYASVMCFLA